MAGFFWFGSMPDFKSYDNLPERKREFIGYILPKIETVNNEILKDRTRLKKLYQTYKAENDLHYMDKMWVLNLAEGYLITEPDLNNEELWNELFARINTIPPSLALAQAAIESAWGTSRFARKGNNIFGHQCYMEGCGIMPISRSGMASHEVVVYETVEDSIRAYAKNLNSNKVYKEFRNIRLNTQESDISGVVLAGALTDYSEIGEKYSEIIRSIILENNLQGFDR